jgi:hypothetical protein
VEISPSPAPPDPARANAMVRDALHKAVLDFEETLERSLPKQTIYTAIPESPGQATAVDFTETGEFPSLSTLLPCKCFAPLLDYYEKICAVCDLSCVADGIKVAPYDEVRIFVNA